MVTPAGYQEPIFWSNHFSLLLNHIQIFLTKLQNGDIISQSDHYIIATSLHLMLLFMVLLKQPSPALIKCALLMGNCLKHRIMSGSYLLNNSFYSHSQCKSLNIGTKYEFVYQNFWKFPPQLMATFWQSLPPIVSPLSAPETCHTCHTSRDSWWVT